MESSKKEVVRLSLSGFMDEEYAFLDKYIAADPIYRQMFLNGKIPPFMADCLAAYKVQVLASKPEPVVEAEWIEKAAREAAEEIAKECQSVDEPTDEPFSDICAAIIKSAIERNAR